MKNTQKRVLIIWVLITIISAAAVIFGFSDYIDMMDGGGALIFTGIIMVSSGLIIVPFYYKRYKIMKEIIERKNIIAEYEYDEVTWKNFVEQEHLRTKKEKFGLGKLVIIISFFINLVLAFLLEDAFVIMGVLFLALVFLILITVFLTTYPTYWKNKKTIGNILIHEKGVCFAGKFQSFGQLGCKYENIELVIDDGVKYLQINYSAPVRYGRESYNIRFPSPNDQNVLKKILNHYSVKENPV